MDNTAAVGLVRPIEHGAAIVMASTTKYIGGHGTSIGGIVIDGGNFDWEYCGCGSPTSAEHADPSYHGAVWAQAASRCPIAFALARTTLLRVGRRHVPLQPSNLSRA